MRELSPWPPFASSLFVSRTLATGRDEERRRNAGLEEEREVQGDHNDLSQLATCNSGVMSSRTLPLSKLVEDFHLCVGRP